MATLALNAELRVLPLFDSWEEGSANGRNPSQGMDSVRWLNDAGNPEHLVNSAVNIPRLPQVR
jgi:hypothetical protein